MSVEKITKEDIAKAIEKRLYERLDCFPELDVENLKQSAEEALLEIAKDFPLAVEIPASTLRGMGFPVPSDIPDFAICDARKIKVRSESDSQGAVILEYHGSYEWLEANIKIKKNESGESYDEKD